MNIATAAIILDESRVLLTRRKEGQKLAGYWEFPGGKVEEGETLQSCLEREILEELSLTVHVGDILTSSYYKYEHGSFSLVALYATIVTGDILLSVHDKVEWVSILNLLNYQLAPADIPIAEVLQETL